MKKWVKIIIGIVLALAIIVAGLVIWQWGNIQAVYTAATQNTEDISEQIEQAAQVQQSSLADYGVTLKSLDTGQTESLLDGTVSAEDIKKDMGISYEVIEQAKAETAQQSSKKEPAKPQKKTKAELEAENKAKITDLINKCTAELYACEIDLMAQVGAIKKEEMAGWIATPVEDRKKEVLIQIGFRGLERCYKLEVSADKQVKEILGRYKKPLKDLGADTGVLDEMWKFYCQKKANQKAYYLNKYLN